MMNASVSALLDAQKALEGVAESLGVHTEQDVVDMVKEIRKERDASGRRICQTRLFFGSGYRYGDSPYD